VGLPVRFAAPDLQRQGRGRVSSDMPLPITQQRNGLEGPRRLAESCAGARSPAASDCPLHFGD
jgi:hypothetical protein